ncbi:MAG TPA: pyridoxal phosphate-dependent aminotransferase family protein [Bdellovibrionota bacterium]
MKKEQKNQLYFLSGKNLGHQQVLEQRGRALRGPRGEFLDYATTNYLGWDFHPRFAELGLSRHQEWGSLSGWSRLEIDSELYSGIEKRLCRMTGGRETILSHTITVTNFSIIPAIAKKGMIFCDQKVHTVVWEACRLARDHGAGLVKFGHQDVSHLEKLLEEHKDTHPKLICVDGVYSISSEYAPIRELQELCRRYDAWLLVDDAHGFGLLGKDPGADAPFGRGGGGVVEFAGGDLSRTFYVASLGKAFCTHTAFVTVPLEYEESLRENCMQYIYSAPLPPFVMGMVEAALDLNDSEGDQARLRIHALTRRFVEGLRALGLQVQNNAYFPIVFWEIGALEDLAWTAERLFARGVVAGIRAFPVVPPNECGLRFGITALHTEAQIDRTLAVIEAISGEFRSLRAG